MTTRQTWQILRKDLRLGPRSPLIVWAALLPLVITLVIRGVFGGLLDPHPRLGIVDLGSSQLTQEALALDGFQVRILDDADTLRRQVTEGNLDAGLVLPADFDSQVRSGAKPPLQIYVGGNSLASNRLVIGITTLDLIRQVAGQPDPVAVDVVPLAPEQAGIIDRLLPLMVTFAIAIAGVMVPAGSLVEEKGRGTIAALLVTPTSVGDVLAAKGALGFVLAMAAGVVTLAVNGALGHLPLALIVALATGAVMMAETGLLLGSWAPDANTMFTAWKGGGIVLFYPVVFFVWPSLPVWIARLGPAYYFLRPVYLLSVEGAGWGDIWVDVVAALAICLVLLPAVTRVGRRYLGEVVAKAPAAAEPAAAAAE